ncbi:MAG: hypothetical protein ACREEB_08230 [Caulobacteraceae bacterium]
MTDRFTSIAEIGWPALRRHPDFRAAVERNAAGIVAQKDRLSPVARWLTNDLGRTAVLSRLLFHTAREGAVTASDLIAATRSRHTSSIGRVLQVLRCAEAAGWIRVGDGEGDWSTRPLIAQPAFMDLWRERALIEIDSASLVAPRIQPALELIESDAGLLGFLGHLARFDGIAPDARGPPNPSIRLFLEHEGGLTTLYDLIGRQDPDRVSLLEAAPFSRRRLATRFNVSRTHVARLFAAAAAAGHLSLATRSRVVFSKAMSDEAERHFALTFHAIATSAMAALEDAKPARRNTAAGL